MREPYQNEIEDLIQTFDRCWMAGDYYSAFGQIARLHSASSKLSATQRQQIQQTVSRISLNPQISKAIQEGVKANIARIVRILSIGSQFVDDEILLILTIRQQLDLVESFTRENFPDIYLSKLDEADSIIDQARRSKKIDEQFVSARRMIRKNSILPTSSAYLDSIFDKRDLFGVNALVLNPCPETRAEMKDCLESRGVNVVTAISVPEALELIKRLRPHIIISELNFPEPGQDGFNFIRTLRSMSAEDGGQIPAVAYADVKSEDRERALADGFQAFVLNSCPPGVLVGCIYGLVSPPIRPYTPYDAQRPVKILSAVDRGIMRDDEFYKSLVLDTEMYPPREIWAAIPERMKTTFTKWLAEVAKRDDCWFITNNNAVNPIVQIRSFFDFVEGRNSGDTPVTGAIWNIWGIR